MEAVASPSQQRWQKRILALCRVSYALSYLCRTNLSIALPEMTAQLHWSAAKAGVLGSVFFIRCGIGHLINGMLGDRILVKKFMLLGLAGTSFCNLLIGFFPYYTVILLVWLDLFFFGAISAMLYGWTRCCSPISRCVFPLTDALLPWRGCLTSALI